MSRYSDLFASNEDQAEEDFKDRQKEEDDKGTEEPEETPEGETSSDEFEIDEDDAKKDAPDVAIRVEDESDLSESFDHLEKTGEDLDQADHTVDALKEAGEELEEVKEAIEAFREDPSQLTALARKTLDQKLRHTGHRLGCDYYVASTEGFVGNRYDDPVFVDSLEAAISDTLRQIMKTIREWIRKAWGLAKQFRKRVLDICRRIHAKAREAKDRLKRNKHGEEEIKTLTDIVIEKTNPIEWGFLENNAIQIFPDHMKRLERGLDGFKRLMETDIQVSQGFISDSDTTMELSQLMGAKGSPQENASKISSEYWGQIQNKVAQANADAFLPGGEKLEVSSAGRPHVRAVAVRPVKPVSSEDLKGMLDAFATPRNLSALADFIERTTAPTGALSKDFEKFTEKFYKDLDKAAESVARKYESAEDAEKLKENSVLSRLQAGVSLGFSATASARKVWLTALHQATNALAIYSANKKSPNLQAQTA